MPLRQRLRRTHPLPLPCSRRPLPTNVPSSPIGHRLPPTSGLSSLPSIASSTTTLAVKAQIAPPHRRPRRERAMVTALQAAPGLGIISLQKTSVSIHVLGRGLFQRLVRGPGEGRRRLRSNGTEGPDS